MPYILTDTVFVVVVVVVVEIRTKVIARWRDAATFSSFPPHHLIVLNYLRAPASIVNTFACFVRRRASVVLFRFLITTLGSNLHYSSALDAAYSLGDVISLAGVRTRLARHRVSYKHVVHTGSACIGRRGDN